AQRKAQRGKIAIEQLNEKGCQGNGFAKNPVDSGFEKQVHAWLDGQKGKDWWRAGQKTANIFHRPVIMLKGERTVLAKPAPDWRAYGGLEIPAHVKVRG